MQIKNKWVIHETHDDGYFVGHSEGVPVFEPLTSRTRTYQTKGYAMKAIGQIKKIECQDYVPEYIENGEVPDVPKDKPFVSEKTCCLYDELHKLCDKYNISFGVESKGFGAELADLARKYRKIIPDVPADKPQESSYEQKEPPIIKYDSGWETVDRFSKRVQYLRKPAAMSYIFAVLCEDGELRGFGFDETAAWIWYSNYRRDIGAKRINERLGKQQSVERGNAEK